MFRVLFIIWKFSNNSNYFFYLNYTHTLLLTQLTCMSDEVLLQLFHQLLFTGNFTRQTKQQLQLQFH